MGGDWFVEVHRRWSWFVAVHGERALSAAVLGFCFVMGATLALGVLVVLRRSLHAWQGRGGSGVEDEATVVSGQQILDSENLGMPRGPSSPPPLPAKWLN
jgi:hypothetical protein